MAVAHFSVQLHTATMPTKYANVHIMQRGTNWLQIWCKKRMGMVFFSFPRLFHFVNGLQCLNERECIVFANKFAYTFTRVYEKKTFSYNIQIFRSGYVRCIQYLRKCRFNRPKCTCVVRNSFSCTDLLIMIILSCEPRINNSIRDTRTISRFFFLAHKQQVCF